MNSEQLKQLIHDFYEYAADNGTHAWEFGCLYDDRRQSQFSITTEWIRDSELDKLISEFVDTYSNTKTTGV